MTGKVETGFAVDGEPLGFYHFTGFDSGAHRILAIKNASASPAVQQLIAWYEGEIAIADRDPISEWPWAFGRFSDGTPIEPGHRWFYRENRDLQQAFSRPLRRTRRPAELPRLVQFGGQAPVPGRVHGARRTAGRPRHADAHALCACGVEIGKRLSSALIKELGEEQPVTGHDASTNGLCAHYQGLKGK